MNKPTPDSDPTFDNTSKNTKTGKLRDPSTDGNPTTTPEQGIEQTTHPTTLQGQDEEGKIDFSKYRNPRNTDNSKVDTSIHPKVVTAVATKTNCDEQTALILIAGILHSTGTAKKAADTNRFEIELEGKVHFITLGLLRQIFSQVTQQSYGVGKPVTLRQYARTIENIILNIAVELGIQGNLAKVFQKGIRGLTANELVFAADYVSPLNTRIPSVISTLLHCHRQAVIGNSQNSFLDLVPEELKVPKMST